jgi:hypothetical protein
VPCCAGLRHDGGLPREKNNGGSGSAQANRAEEKEGLEEGKVEGLGEKGFDQFEKSSSK